jgi:hypothetical protein
MIVKYFLVQKRIHSGDDIANRLSHFDELVGGATLCWATSNADDSSLMQSFMCCSKRLASCLKL